MTTPPAPPAELCCGKCIGANSLLQYRICLHPDCVCHWSPPSPAPPQEPCPGIVTFAWVGDPEPGLTRMEHCPGCLTHVHAGDRQEREKALAHANTELAKLREELAATKERLRSIADTVYHAVKEARQ